MNAIEPGLLASNPWVTRRPLTVDEFYRIAEAGMLSLQHSHASSPERDLILGRGCLGADHRPPWRVRLLRPARQQHRGADGG